jgi:hypothetical protein
MGGGGVVRENERDEYCHSHAEKLNELRSDVKGIATYIPKIEAVLERSLAMQESLKSATETNKEIFTILRHLTEDLSRIKSDEIAGLKIKAQEMNGRLKALEESRRGVLQIVSPVWTAVIIGSLGAILALVVTHGIGGIK